MAKKEEIQKAIVTLWMEYQNSGTEYGNSFNGFIEWLKDRELSNG